MDNRRIQNFLDYMKQNYVLRSTVVSKKVLEDMLGSQKNYDDIPATLPFTDVLKFLEAYIKGNRSKVKFSHLVEKHLAQKNMTPKDHYIAAGIDRRLYHNIFHKNTYHPSKNTAIALGMALHLNREEMNEFLEKTGYILTNSSILDLIIMFCIQMQIYEIGDINAILLAMEQKPLIKTIE